MTSDDHWSPRRFSAMLMVMDPNSAPLPPSPSPETPNNPNDYNFIINPQKPKKSALLMPSFLTGGSMVKRIAIFGGGFVLLLVIIGIFGAVLSSSNNKATASMVELVEEQQEIARVAQLGVSGAGRSETKSYALIVNLSIVSDQQQLTAYLKKAGKKITTKQLALKKNTKTDAAFAVATQANSFDDTFTTTINSELATYQVHVRNAFNGTKSLTARGVLNQSYTGVATLLNAKSE